MTIAKGRFLTRQLGEIADILFIHNGTVRIGETQSDGVSGGDLATMSPRLPAGMWRANP
jgi:hypothetical protein